MLSREVHLLILILAMLAGGLISCYFGKDIAWDVAAYHYYNPYAFLHHRAAIDYWPAAIIQSYFNPMLDLLGYFLIQTMSPITVQFVLGALHGINFWLIFYISSLFAPLYLALLLAACGMYGPVAFSELGSLMGDNTISLFVLSSVLLLLLYFKKNESLSCQRKLASNNLNTFLDTSFRWYDSSIFVLTSGFLLGLGAGFKLTAAIYLIGALAGLLLLPIATRTKIQLICYWILAFSFGFILTAGYWMFFLWQHYHNPFFPLWNGIFHAVGFPAFNWLDTRHFPHSLMQTIFFPFYFAWNGQTTDLQRFIDFRFPIAYSLLILAGLSWLVRKKSKPNDPATIWLFIFFIFSYLAWQVNFSVMRYLVAAEILCPLIIYLSICYLIQNDNLKLGIQLYLLLLIAMTMSFMPHERTRHYGASYFNIVMPTLTSSAKPLVLVAFPAIWQLAPNPYPFPENYLLPYFPPSFRFIGIPFYQDRPEKLSEKIITLIKQQQGKIYVLANQYTLPGMFAITNQLGLKQKGICQRIASELEPEGAFLCELSNHFF